MIFSPTLVKKILSGRKTETRLPVKAAETICRYKPGRHYALQHKCGGREITRIEILAVERQCLGDITFESVRCEGFKTTDEFREYWIELYGHFDPDQDVWAIKFTLKGDPIRLLARDSSRGYVEDVSQALGAGTRVATPSDIEPEAVSDQDAGLYTEDARERFNAGRQDEIAAQQARRLVNKMAKLQLEAAKMGVDIIPALKRAIRETQAEIVSKRQAAA